MEKSWKAFLLTPLLFIVFIIVTGCNYINNTQNKIYNNDNTQLQQGDSYTFKDKLGEIEDEKVNINFTDFTGLYSIWDVTTSLEQTLSLSIKGNIKRGDFKIIGLHLIKKL